MSILLSALRAKTGLIFSVKRPLHGPEWTAVLQPVVFSLE